MESKGKTFSEIILSDNTSGSAELLLRINKFVLENRLDISGISRELNKLKNGLPSFAAVQSYIKKAERLLKANNPDRLMDFAQYFANSLSSEDQFLFSKGWEVLKSHRTIITLSNSLTVSKFIQEFSRKKPSIKIIIAESRPRYEGRIMAEALLAEGINITFITDAAIFQFAEKADAALIGADMILKDKSAVNKTGSCLLALSCRYFGKSFYVLAGRNKFSIKKSYKEHYQPENEVWDRKHPKLKVVNSYFERIPAELITGIISNNI